MSAPRRPARPGRPARQIQGPQSALTDFLASHNIDANRIRQDADARRAAAHASRQNENGNSEDASSPSVEPEAQPAPPRRKETKAQQAKRKKKEEKEIAKIKASKSFKRSRRGYDPDDLTDEDDAARAIFEETRAPLPGQMENCEICDTRFTVTAYSRTGPGGGLLCPPCTKELDDEEGAARKKRKTSGRNNRRKTQSNLLDGIYQRGAKNLMTLCIETLAKNVDLAEDLGDLPAKLVDRLAGILSKRRLMDSNTLNLFLRPGNDSITLYDCGRLSSDDFIRIFQVVPTLKDLRIRSAIQFKNKVMDYLIGSPVQLESFSIHGANLVDDERWISYLVEKGRYLRALKVYFTDGHFGDEQLELLKVSCPELERLKICHNQKVSDEGIKQIAHLPSLQHLSLEMYKITTSEPYVEVLNSIGNGLRTLSLSRALYIDDTVLEAIHNNCVNLQKLRITENEVLTDDGFVQLFTNWSNPALTFIDFEKCRHIESSDPRENKDNIGLCSGGFEAMMAHSGAQLQHLNIEACRHISREAFENVFSATKKYPELRVIDASFCWAVDDFVVGSIFRSCPNLKTLKVFGNFGVRDVKVPKGKILIGMPNAIGMQIEGED